jgi:hypothetical protein
MVLTQVQNKIFNVQDKYITGSKTIENLLHDTKSPDINQPIPIFVDLYDWGSYLDFLYHDQLTVGALKVIDYLDNLQQARHWCKLEYQFLRQQEEHRYHINDTRDAMINFINDTNVIRNIMIKTINTYTEFIPDDVLPLEVLNNLETILLHFKNIGDKEVPLEDMRDIIYNLYSTRISLLYGYLVNDIKKLDIKTAKDAKFFAKHGFILESADHTNIVINKNQTLSGHSNDNYYNSGDTDMNINLMEDAQSISPRIAEYYENIRTYNNYGKNLIYCPNDKPYLHSRGEQITGRPSEIKNLSCKTTQSTYDIIEPVNVYQVNSKYKPYEGFQTNIKIGNEYELFTYNLPSTYSRDYYIFLTYEYDPIAKVIYAFSI